MSKMHVALFIVMVLALLMACSPQTPESIETPLPTPTQTSQSTGHLTPNNVETSKPIYGGIIRTGYYLPSSFDGHQYAGYGPTAQLPVFNQLVIFDMTYRETVPETIIGDLAESWETNQDGTEITFKLRQGVKWHDGAPFTADDVIYSLDKMTDVNRSAIANWFPAYKSTEKIDDYTVKVYLQYPSTGFMLSLAQGESQIQALHLAGTDAQSVAFMVGTGPFILTKYLPGVELDYERNPHYWKKDKYGNQLPYLDGIKYYHSTLAAAQNLLIGRRLDLLGASSGAGTLDAYQYLKEGAPELLWERRERFNGDVIHLNTKHPPLNDIRVRRAMSLVLKEDDLILGYTGDPMFAPQTPIGILHPAYGLPKEDITKLMDWDKPYEERVSEAQRLLAEAGYPNGFKLRFMAGGDVGDTMVYAEALRKYLKIDSEMIVGIGTIEIQKRLDDDTYDAYTRRDAFTEPAHFQSIFKTDGYANASHYSNPELDKIIDDLDRILDSDRRREAFWAIERILLTDLPALPTGCYIASFMPFYPPVKNFRNNNIVYSNLNRFEDIWLDESLRVK